ncbi:MAG: tetratricopeptide repeat protein [Bacteroidetes bacterium]|nr:tetratricopeptide repeat protein [Bacteroidota bacterium]
MAVQKDRGEFVVQNIRDTSDVNNLISMVEIIKDSEPRRALQVLEGVYDRAGNLEYTAGQAQIKYMISAIYKNLNILDSALIENQMAQSLYTILDNKSGIANCLNLQGSLLKRDGNYYSALDKHRESLTYFMHVYDTMGLIKSYNYIGLIQKNLSNFDSAAIYFMKVITFSEKIGFRDGHVAGLINLSEVLSKLNQFTDARMHLEKCIQLQSEGENMLSLAISYSKLAGIYYMEKNYTTAIQFYIKSDSIYQKIENREGMANVSLNLASSYYELGNINKARQYYQLGYKQFKENSDKAGILNVYMNLAVLNEESGRFSEAILYYDSSLNLAKRLNARDELLEIYFNTHLCYKKLGQTDKSLTFLTQYINLNDSIYTLEKARLINDLGLKYETEKKEAQILTLNNENLRKDLELHKALNRKNGYLAAGGFLLMLTIFTFIYFRLRIRKNRLLNEQKLLNAKEEQKLSSAKALLEGQEQERIRVSRELHDGIGLLLSTSNLHLKKAIDNGLDDHDVLNQAKDLVNRANEDVRRISRGLFPPVLQVNGLHDGIEDLLAEVDKIPDKYGSFFIKGEPIRLSETREIMVYRIMQELINNFLKHSRGDTIDVEMEYTASNLIIHYLENGTGFNFDSHIAGKSVGLKSIQSRITFLNASFDFISEKSETRIKIEVPLRGK